MIEAHTDVRSYFRERIVAAFERRRMMVAEMTEFYLVELLVRNMNFGPDSAFSEPLIYQMKSALEAGDANERFRKFRYMGDNALYVCGFFADHLHRRGISRDYVVGMGGRAYIQAGGLARWVGGSEAPFETVFHSLSEGFDAYANVIDDVREATALRTPQDIVRLYDKWLQTRSPRIAERLRAAGVFPQIEKESDPTVH